MATNPIVPVRHPCTVGDNLIYACPTVGGVRFACINLNVCATTQAANVTLAIGTGASPADGDFVLKTYPVAPGGAPIRLEREILTPGVSVFVTPDKTGVNAVLTGLVEQ